MPRARQSMHSFGTSHTQLNPDLFIICSSYNSPFNIDRSYNASSLGSAHKLTIRSRSVLHSTPFQRIMKLLQNLTRPLCKQCTCMHNHNCPTIDFAVMVTGNLCHFNVCL